MLTKADVYRIEHQLIEDYSLWDLDANDPKEMFVMILYGVCGIHDMAQELVRELDRQEAPEQSSV